MSRRRRYRVVLMLFTLVMSSLGLSPSRAVDASHGFLAASAVENGQSVRCAPPRPLQIDPPRPAAVACARDGEASAEAPSRAFRRALSTALRATAEAGSGVATGIGWRAPPGRG